MSFDLNDVEPIGELIPDGTFAKMVLTVRPGGVDGHAEVDKGLLKASNAPGSDVRSLECELIILAGPHRGRRFWHLFTVAGGKVDDKGGSIGWNISKRIFRGMIDSALGLDPRDTSDQAKEKRQLRGLADLNGITFVGKVAIEPNSDPRYPEQNKLDRPVLPTEKEWRLVMEGKDVPPSPSRSRSRSTHGSQGATTVPKSPIWRQDTSTPQLATPHPESAPATAEPTKAAGPAWLNG